MNHLNTKGEMLSPTNLYDVARKRIGELKKIEKEKELSLPRLNIPQSWKPSDI